MPGGTRLCSVPVPPHYRRTSLSFQQPRRISVCFLDLRITLERVTRYGREMVVTLSHVINCHAVLSEILANSAESESLPGCFDKVLSGNPDESYDERLPNS